MKRAMCGLVALGLAACAGEAAPSPPAVAPARAVRYLALGDSFTIGTGSSPEAAFPARLAARLRQGGSAVALENLGVNGFTTSDLIEVELPEVRGFAPTFVTLAIGANDLVHGESVNAYRTHLRRIFAGLSSAGVAPARVVCLPQPDWARSPAARSFGDPNALEHEIDRFNAAMREEASRAGARYVDLDPLFRAQAQAGMVAGDGLHPSAAAHDAWAAALARETAL